MIRSVPADVSLSYLTAVKLSKQIKAFLHLSYSPKLAYIAKIIGTFSERLAS